MLSSNFRAFAAELAAYLHTRCYDKEAQRELGIRVREARGSRQAPPRRKSFKVPCKWLPSRFVRYESRSERAATSTSQTPLSSPNNLQSTNCASVGPPRSGKDLNEWFTLHFDETFDAADPVFRLSIE